MLIYYLPVDSRIDLVSAVVHGHSLQQGDRLIVGTKPSVRTTQKSLIRKLLKVVTNLRQFQQHGQSVIIVVLVLLVMILLATLTYVCIERDPNNRFLNIARSLGIPGIQGDASLPATLPASPAPPACSMKNPLLQEVYCTYHATNA